MAEKLSGNVGWGIGLEFRESNHLLRTRNTAACRPSMAFNVVVGAAALTHETNIPDTPPTCSRASPMSVFHVLRLVLCCLSCMPTARHLLSWAQTKRDVRLSR